MSRSYFIHTFGCQMNESDSQRMAEALASAGWVPAEAPERADLVLVNTCAIREKAEDKLYSALGRYRLLACREGTKLLGYCLVKLKKFENDSRMGDIRMGTIVDCVVDPDDAGVVNWLLRSAVELCRREQMDVVFCSASHREIRRYLRWNGFLGMRGTLHVAVHDRTGGLRSDVPLEAWHLMRGDSDADANC